MKPVAAVVCYGRPIADPIRTLAGHLPPPSIIWKIWVYLEVEQANGTRSDRGRYYGVVTMLRGGRRKRTPKIAILARVGDIR
jgi:hypothetical protein